LDKKLDFDFESELFREQLHYSELALSDTLLVAIREEWLDCRAITLQAIRPRIAIAEQKTVRAPEIVRYPSGGDVGRLNVVASAHAGVLRRVERIEKVARDPWICLIQAALHGNDVHDRKDAGPGKVALLFLSVIWIEPPDDRLAFHEAARRSGRYDRVDLFFHQHLAERAVPN
jgi:hypothetical protein